MISIYENIKKPNLKGYSKTRSTKRVQQLLKLEDTMVNSLPYVDGTLKENIEKVLQEVKTKYTK